MSWSEVRPWHADISWPVISACPKFQKNPKSKIIDMVFGTEGPSVHQGNFACHGLTSDQDMQRVSEFWVAYFRCSKVLCMPRSDLRPGHAKGFGILGSLL